MANNVLSVKDFLTRSNSSSGLLTELVNGESYESGKLGLIDGKVVYLTSDVISFDKTDTSKVNTLADSSTIITEVTEKTNEVVTNKVTELKNEINNYITNINGIIYFIESKEVTAGTYFLKENNLYKAIVDGNLVESELTDNTKYEVVYTFGTGSLILEPATESKLGGVIVGDGLSVTDGKISVIVDTTDLDNLKTRVDNIENVELPKKLEEFSITSNDGSIVVTDKDIVVNDYSNIVFKGELTTELANKVDTTIYETKINSIDTDINNLNTNLNEEITNRTDEITRIETEYKEADSNLKNDLLVEINKLATKDELTNEVNTLVSKDNELLLKINTNATDITNLTTKVDDNTLNINNNATEISTINAKITGLESKIGDNLTKIEDNLNKINTNVDDITKIKGKINDYDNFILDSSNELADKNYVKSLVSSSGSEYITSDASGSGFSTAADLKNGPYFAKGVETTTLNDGDYAIVLADEDNENASTSYVYYNGNWTFRYKVGTAFTTDQQAAIDSGITKDDLTTIKTDLNGVILRLGKELDNSNSMSLLFKVEKNAENIDNINTSISKIYTKQEVDDAIAAIDHSIYATKDDIQNKADIDYSYSKLEADAMVDTKVGNINDVNDVLGTTYTNITEVLINAINGRYSKTEIDTKLADKADVATTYTKQEVDDAIAAIDYSTYATKVELDTKADNDKVYTKDEVDTKVTDLEDKINLKSDTTYVDSKVTEVTDAYIAADKVVDDKVTEVDNKVGDISTLTTPINDPATTLLTVSNVVDAIRVLDRDTVKSVDVKDYSAGNGISIDTNKEISVDDSIVATKSYVDPKFTNLENNKANSSDVYTKFETYTQTEVNNKVNELDTKVATKVEQSVYDAKVTEIETNVTDISNKYTELNTKLDDKLDKTVIDSYYTKDEVDNKIDSIDYSTYATKVELADKLDKAEIDNYYTKTDVDDKLSLKSDATYVDGKVTEITTAYKLADDEISKVVGKYSTIATDTYVGGLSTDSQNTFTVIKTLADKVRANKAEVDALNKLSAFAPGVEYKIIDIVCYGSSLYMASSPYITDTKDANYMTALASGIAVRAEETSSLDLSAAWSLVEDRFTPLNKNMAVVDYDEPDTTKNDPSDPYLNSGQTVVHTELYYLDENNNNEQVIFSKSDVVSKATTDFHSSGSYVVGDFTKVTNGGDITYYYTLVGVTTTSDNISGYVTAGNFIELKEMTSLYICKTSVQAKSNWNTDKQYLVKQTIEMTGYATVKDVQAIEAQATTKIASSIKEVKIAKLTVPTATNDVNIGIKDRVNAITNGYLTVNDPDNPTVMTIKDPDKVRFELGINSSISPEAITVLDTDYNTSTGVLTITNSTTTKSVLVKRDADGALYANIPGSNSDTSLAGNAVVIKSQLDDALANIDYTNYVTKTELSNGLATKVEQSVYDAKVLELATKEEVSNLETSITTAYTHADTDLKDKLNVEITKKANSVDVYTKTEIYTKQEVDNKINNIDYSTYATKAELDTKANTTDLDNYYTKNEIDNKIDSIDYSNYATKTELADKADKSDTYTKQEVDNKVDEVSNEFINYLPTAELETNVEPIIDAKLVDKATTTYVDTEVAKVDAKITAIDLTPYATKVEVADKANTTDVYAKTETYTRDEVDNKVTTEVSGVANNLSTNYYTKTQVDTKTTTIENSITTLTTLVNELQTKLNELSGTFAYNTTASSYLWSQSDYDALTTKEADKVYLIRSETI